jgi:hypothetical protein
MASDQDLHPKTSVAAKATNRAPPHVFLGVEGLLRVALVAAAVLLGVQSALMAMFAHQDVWKTSWVIAAVFMGPEVLRWPAVFDMAAITAAIAALYPTSFLCVLILLIVEQRLSVKWSILTGVMVGFLFFFVDLHVLTRLFPWLAEERNWMAALSHLVFGGVAAWLLERAGEGLD